MVAKIRAAVDARVDSDLLIMARTDALAVSGLDDAIERMYHYLEAGADLSFVESPVSVDQMRRITREIEAPNMANMVPGAKSPNLTARDLQEMGFAIVAYPTMLTYAMTRIGEQAFAHLRANGTPVGFEAMMDFSEFNRFIGLDEVRGKESALSAWAEGGESISQR
jgi:methylisocitrate lyase